MSGIRRLALVPDSNVLDTALQWHCSVFIAEVTAGIAHYAPNASRWRRVARRYGILLAAILDARLLVPDAETWHLAGAIAGTLARTQRFQPHQREECLNDALIHLTAAKQGLPVVNANRLGFNVIQHIAPGGTFPHFRRRDPPKRVVR